MYLNVNNPVNYQLQGFGQNGVRTISTDQLYIQGEYYRVLVAEEDSYVTAVSVLGDDLTAEFVYAGTTIYGLFTEVSVTSGSLTAYIAGPTDIEDVWAYINAYGEANAARIEAADCAKDAIAPLLDKYYAKASLVMVPSLYKTSIVYSERPLTTAGQLAFTRSNDTATRVGPDGYIEKVRTNVLTYSNDFSNAAWSPYEYGGASFVRTYGQNDPFGGITAVKFDISVATGGVLFTQNFTTSANAEHGLSVWLKGAVGGEKVQIDLKNTASAGVAGGLLTLTTEWVRYKITANNVSGTSRGFQFRITTSQISGSESFYVYGSQAEIGVPTDYIPTTTTAVSVGPVANLPRLNYPINSDGSVGCPSLLLEPQRTNLNPYSEQFDNAEWEKTNTTITANATTSPDGYTNADALFETTTNDWHRLYDNGISVTSGTAYTCSLFVKPNGRDWVSIEFFAGGGGFNGSRVWFNIANGTIGTTQTGITAKIENYGNGWYRISATQTAAATTTGYILYLLATADGVVTYAGDVTKGAFVYGGMTEAASYATSYIPTLGAAVTRGADSCIKTGISSLIGQTEGTLFGEFNVLANQESQSIWIRQASGGLYNEFLFMLTNNAQQPRVQVVTGGVTQFDHTASSISVGYHKFAFAYKQNDFAFYIDGVQIATSSSGLVPTCNEMYLGTYPDGGTRQTSQKQALLFKTRLSNQELQDLTTL
jgi:hypothetical protein